MKQQKVEIQIPKTYKPNEREAIAIDVVEFIRERTKRGLDKNNEKFPGYSKSYKKSIDFKVAGKSSTVNLTLTGDMLDLLDVLNTQSGKIVVGYEKGDEINGKVEGNRLGTYGQSKSTGKKRDFLGITKKDLKTILEKYPLNDDEKRMERVASVIETKEQSKDIEVSEEDESE